MATVEPARSGNLATGRVAARKICFIHPLVDYLLVGGALSIPVVALAVDYPSITPQDRATLLTVFLLFNYAHFAASAVRLYTKPEDRDVLRFVWFGLPVVMLAVLTVATIWPEALGRHLWALFLTWSPYHYAAQAYGLTLIYSYRSGYKPGVMEKRALWCVAMLPFCRAFLNAPESGLAWFIPHTTFESIPWLAALHAGSIDVMAGLTLILPAWTFFRSGRKIPPIGLIILLSNGIWWVSISYTDAWFWATVFHSLQYLIVITAFHVRDNTSQQKGSRGAGYHAITFYGMSVLLGVAMFIGLPTFYRLTGLGNEKAGLMVAAAMSIHHFVVDGYIWRSRKSVTGVPPAAGGVA